MIQIFSQEWTQIMIILISCMHSFTVGQFFTWPSPTIPRLVYDEYPSIISFDEATYLTIIPFVALILASPFTALFMDLFGRKLTLFLIAIPYIISWTLTAIGGSIYVFYIAKIFSGISDSCTFATVPAYISEISTPKVRSTWGSSLPLSIIFGNFIMNVIGAYFSIQVTALILLMVPVSFCFLIFILPESPYYLIMKKEDYKARQVLKWLRRKDDVEQELEQMKLDVARQLSEKGGYKDLFSIKSNRKAIFIGLSLRGFQLFSGLAVLSLYAQIIFLRSGINLSAGTSTIIYSGLLFFLNLLSSLFLDRVNRRKAMVVSSLGSGCVLAFLSTYLYLLDNGIDMTDYNILPLILLILFAVFFSLALSTVPFLMMGELFSSSIKGKAMCLMNMWFGLVVCSNSKLFSFLTLQYGMAIPFYIFCACCFLGAICFHFIVPETRGKTLEEIQQSFKKHERS